MLDTIRQAWGWTGLDPAELIAINAFGNVLLRSSDGAYWRICPEELSCNRIAQDEPQMRSLWQSQEFQLDWHMDHLRELARQTLGPLPESHSYCLKVSSVLGGTYDHKNLAIIPTEKHLSFTGELSEKIKDVLDGATIKIEWVD